MASRESQGLQIALILFVMITVVLAVTTFVFYRKSEEARKTVAAANEKAKQKDTLYNDENFKVQYLQHILGAATLSEAELNVIVPGIEGDPVMGPIHKAYQEDMVTYGEGLPQEKMNYRELPANLLQAIRKLNIANTDLNVQSNRLVDERKKEVETQTMRTKEAEGARDKAVAQLDSERNQFNKDRAGLKTTQEKQFADYKTAINQQKTQVAKRDSTIKVRETEIKDLTTTVSQQKSKITELLDEPFESPDGRIVWVNQASQTVWVNLGLADGLRRQTTFSVYDHEAMNVAQGSGHKKKDDEQQSKRMIDERKGGIEITRVLDQHLAEARIVEDWPDDPILPGDQIFSPSWKPGRKVHFALVGFMDMDGDGRSDRDLIRNIIAMGGGVIDAEVHDDGQVEGELSATTRYLVRGKNPDGSDPKLLSSFSNMVGAAETQGTQEISLLMLLDLMGYKAEVRTVGLGKRADPEQFKAKPAEGKARSASGNVSGVFKERRPPKRSKKGDAY